MDKKNWVGFWLYSICTMVLMMVVIGGITRLTGSGLSITEWKPIMGALPPKGELEWQEAFLKYQQSPQYLLVNHGMSLSEFQWIFFWEYFHRLVGRLIGLVVVLPLVFFIYKKVLDQLWIKRILLGLLLGGLQGLMGWLMVKSGLVDEPRVSHFRLAAHLILAMLIFIYFLWMASKWRFENLNRLSYQPENLSLVYLFQLGKLLYLLLGISILQIFYGALVAGLRAGYMAGTFPLMGNEFFPSGGLLFKPLHLNFLNNPLTVQWTHRMIAWVLYLGVAILWFFYRKKVDRVTRENLNLLFIWVNIQFILGVSVLLTGVYVPLAVLHQVGAFAVLTYILRTQWHLLEVRLSI
jgi:cytochrome c oxidase assembly protein subunit 15